MRQSSVRQAPAHRVVRIVSVTLSLWMLPLAATAGETDVAERLHRLLSQWRLTEVEAALAERPRPDPEADTLRAVKMRLRHMRRDYQGALEASKEICLPDPSVDETPGANTWARYCEIVQGSVAVTRHFDSHATTSGNFMLHYSPGPDEILLPHAEEALEGAHQHLSNVLGYQPSEPVQVDILPRAEELARMTPLSREAIENSGTIAMCKYNRIMLVSPRDLVYGYEWQNALAHEYVHFVLTKSTFNRVPLWLHEGLAKYLEKGWRPGATPRLPPASELMLAEAVRRRRLIGFDKMYPSFGLLPSQEDTALAFAQVFSLVEWMKHNEGIAGIRTLLRELKTRGEQDQALREVYGMDFRQLTRAWRRWLLRRPAPTEVHGRKIKKLFRGRDTGLDELADIAQQRARDLTYLGDLLRVRGRYQAALKQYQKADREIDPASPVLQAKTASALVALERFDEVLPVVARVREAHPGYVLLHLLQGEALLRLGQPGEALEALETAIGINPFDERLHLLLAEAYDALGMTEKATFSRRQHTLLR